MILENIENATRSNGSQAMPAGMPAAPPARQADFERLCSAAFEQAPHGIILLEAETTGIAAVNRFALSLLRCAEEDLIGKRLAEVPLFRDLDISKNIAHTIQAAQVIHCDDVLVTGKDGQAFILEISFRRYLVSCTPIIHCEIRDLTMRKRREIARRRERVMQALRRMALRMADEFNGLLPAVARSCEIRAEPFERLTGDLRKAKARIAALAGELSAFGGAGPNQPQALNLNAVIHSMEDEIRGMVGQSAEIVLALDAEPAWTQADEKQVRQIVRQLVANACGSMTTGGVLTVRTCYAGKDDGDGAEGASGWICLEVTDNGRPLDAEGWSRLFELFPSGSENAEDCGLGLASVYSMVKQNGGHITVLPGDGSGTAFRIWLPQTAEAVDHASPAAPEAAALPQLQTSAETVLILEPEEGLRNVMRNLLSRKGYAVAVARSEGEVETLLHRGGPMRLIVADISSSSPGAARLARQVAEMRPAARALYILDAGGDVNMRAALLPPDAPVIEKPFRLEALLARMREVLDE